MRISHFSFPLVIYSKIKTSFLNFLFDTEYMLAIRALPLKIVFSIRGVMSGSEGVNTSNLPQQKQRNEKILQINELNLNCNYKDS